ncbi:hypothetical protein [Clostridium thermobutyricum]|uniref:hypothetical protein n=1 Tax=Clostridium thermobutyricum TaxID=29372 RepID=UPI002941D115|nr:hypothetical protein [Clostridium thermobutyricum]
MNIFIKKSKIFWLCVFPFLAILGSIYSIFDPNWGPPLQTFSNSNTAGSLTNLFFSLFITILLYAIYLYIGIVFFRKRFYISYKILSFINFFWFGLNTIALLYFTFLNMPSTTKPISFFSNAILYSVIIVFQIIDIYLLVTYNNNQKNLITTHS